VEVQHERVPSDGALALRRERIGVAALLALLVAVPALTTAGVAVTSYTGCFIECSQPYRWRALGFFILTLAFVSVPIAALWSRRFARRRSWFVTAGLGFAGAAELLVDGLGLLGLAVVAAVLVVGAIAVARRGVSTGAR
jgi:hypothetical protein